MLKFYVKVFYVMGKALSGELSCPCVRSCFLLQSTAAEKKGANSRVASSESIPITFILLVRGNFAVADLLHLML